MLSASIPTQFYDFHKVKIKLTNLTTGRANLSALPFPTDSIESLSCMHVIEHIGLGQYGDPLDYDGDLKAINEITRVLKSDGDMLFVVPIGKPKIMFNAHRVYSYQQIMSYFSNYNLLEFSLIPDNGNEIGIIENANQEIADSQTYGCGCFWFKKI